jgi:hypothetical protein
MPPMAAMALAACSQLPDAVTEREIAGRYDGIGYGASVPQPRAIQLTLHGDHSFHRQRYRRTRYIPGHVESVDGAYDRRKRRVHLNPTGAGSEPADRGLLGEAAGWCDLPQLVRRRSDRLPDAEVIAGKIGAHQRGHVQSRAHHSFGLRTVGAHRRRRIGLSSGRLPVSLASCGRLRGCN